jgi:hypothetical protein
VALSCHFKASKLRYSARNSAVFIYGAEMQKLTLRLGQAEWEALVDLSIKECRPAQYQAEYLLRQALEQSGLLPIEQDPARAELESKPSQEQN